MFRALYDRIGGMELAEIWRQKKSWMKEATILLERNNGKKAMEAIDLYNEHKRIHEHADKETAFDAIAAAFRKNAMNAMESWPREKDSQLVIAYRNADVDELNQRIREEARKIGKLEKTEYEFKTANGFRTFAVGDRIIFQKNDQRIGVKNGSLGTITKMHLGFAHIRFDVDLDNEQQITFKTSTYNEFDLGYAATAHKTQGITLADVIVYGDRCFDRHAALVSLSRHKENVSLHYDRETFKDGYPELRKTLGQDQSKILATDVIDYRKKDLEPIKPQRSHTQLHAETTQLLSEMSKELAQKGTALRERLQGESTGVREKAQIERELENYRRSINLVSFARSVGYEVDASVKSRHATVMSRKKVTPDDSVEEEKIVVSTDRKGRGVYASTNREKEQLPNGKIKFQHEDGDIIDFAKKRLNTESIEQIRRELLPWLTDRRGWHRQPERKYLSSPDVKKNAKEYATLIKKYEVWGSSARASKYLTNKLSIDSNVIDSRFDRVVKSDFYKNAMFAHCDKKGEICGYDYKGVIKRDYEDKEISRFSRGGQLGLWKSSNVGTAEKIVITSSGVDALSHAQLHKTGKETAYISVGDRNKLSKAQEEHIKETLRREGRRGAKIVLAVNKDNADTAQKLKEMSPEGAKVERVVPHGKDWNDLLRHTLEQRVRDEVRDRDRGIGFKDDFERMIYEREKEKIRRQVDREYGDDDDRDRSKILATDSKGYTPERLKADLREQRRLKMLEKRFGEEARRELDREENRKRGRSRSDDFGRSR
jgi:ATP-dependent exoDNAse (exonuclease V) alpha subunit